MKTGVYLAACIVGVFLALLVQERIPAFSSLGGARLQLVPMIFCYAAISLPFPAMLGAAMSAGFLTDLWYLHVVNGRVEIALGWTIVYFVVFGIFTQGFRPAFRRGHWWIFCSLSGAGTSLFLALQFAMLSFRRMDDGFVFNELVFWRIVIPGLLAAILSPAVHFGMKQLDQFLPQSVPTPRRNY